MNAKKLLQKHIELLTPKDRWVSDKERERIINDASINAINEALTLNKDTE